MPERAFQYRLMASDTSAPHPLPGPGCEEVLGYPPEAFRDNPALWFERMEEEEQRGLLAFWASPPDHERPLTFTHSFRHRDGSELWLGHIFCSTGGSRTGAVVDISDTRKLLSQCQLAESRFREVLSHSRHVLYRFDFAANRYDYVSPSIFDLTGYTVEEWLAKTAEDVSKEILPEDWERLNRRMAEATAARTGNTGHMTIDYRRRIKNGDIRWVRDWTTLFFDDDGNLLAAAGAGCDITESKNREAAQEALKSLAVALGATLDIREAYDRIVECACRASGLPSAALLALDPEADEYVLVSHQGMREVAARHHARIPANHTLFTRLRRSGSLFTDREGMRAYMPELRNDTPARSVGLIPILHKEEMVALLVAYSPVPGGLSEPARETLETIGREAGGAIRRLRMESALHRSHALLGAVMESTADGILVESEAGEVLAHNRRLLELWNLPKDWPTLPSAEKRYAHLRSRMTAPEVFDRLRDPPLAKGEETTGEAVTPEERAIECRRRAYCLDGAVAGSLWTFRDVTEKRRMEEHLHRADKMEAIGHLAGGVAHDINNLLSPITLYSDMLGRHLRGDPRLGQYAHTISAASARCADLTGKLLAFARKGKQRSVAVDLAAVVQEVLVLLEPSLDDHVAVETEFADPPAIARGDPTQLQSVILNLALNARDALDGKGRLRIETAVVARADVPPHHSAPPVPGAERYARVRVIDTGSGIDETTLPHIFEPFFTTKEAGAGSGLGLSAAYGVVRNHQGLLHVTSEPGHGSTFEVYLPQCEEGAPATPLEKEPAPRHITHVLVADDEPALRDLVHEVLEEEGIRVTGCETSSQAIRFFDEGGAADAVLLDMQLPGIEIPEAVRRLRSVSPTPTVILFTAYSDEANVRHALDAGAAGVLQKPFTRASLMNALGAAGRLGD